MLHFSAAILALTYSGLARALPYSSGNPEPFTNQTAIPTPVSPSTTEGSRGHNSFATPSPSGSNSNYNVSGHREPHESDHSIVTVTVDCASASMFTNVPDTTGINGGGDVATGSLGQPFSYPGDGATMAIPSGYSSPSSDGFPSGPVATPSDPDALPSESALSPSSTSDAPEPVITSSTPDTTSPTGDAPEPVITNSESITDVSPVSPSSDSVTDEPEITGSESLVSDTTLPTTTLGARDDQGNYSATTSRAASFTNIPSAGAITRVPSFTGQSGIPNKSAVPISSSLKNGQPKARPSGMPSSGHGMNNDSGAPEGQKGARTVTVCAASLPSTSA